jgi:hypothetical protein
MLKNHSLSVDLVKKNKAHDETNNTDIGFEEKARIISSIVESNAVKVGLAVCAYVLLDTFRKATIAAVSK